ncbi:unnamed protein product [Acanthoscelides obtectus]|uniref:Rhodanese domain-containing protein n=1 Tax=Acanthoscelides obtectus TaxID=200917 RepID=A0A9P0KUA1_ACAOB|nr:unnamed protein product [Acanthoscelides obtectus]CAK1654821.1 Rhodanese domain-containing protein CG4456 [Acanthoscelides obtectus]
MVFGRITCDELKEMLDNMPPNTTIIDVRETSEVEHTGVIGPSLNIPLSDLKNAMKKTREKIFRKKFGREKPDQKHLIIFYCLGETRAERGADMFHSWGYKKHIRDPR